jgi:hypothetical protein
LDDHLVAYLDEMMVHQKVDSMELMKEMKMVEYLEDEMVDS